MQVHVPDVQWGQTKWNVGVGSRERFIAGPCKEMGGFYPKNLWAPQRFQQSTFKSRVRDAGHRVCDQTVHNSLIGWWRGSRSLIGWWWGSSHVWMWELDHKESWVPKNGCFWTVVLEKTLERPLDCMEIQPVHLKGDQSWIFIGRTDAEAETPIRWPPDVKNWLIWKDPDAGKDWRWEEKGMAEDEMVGWHHLLNGHEFEWTPGVGDGQGGLECCSPWGHKESDMTERLNGTEVADLWLADGEVAGWCLGGEHYQSLGSRAQAWGCVLLVVK